MHMGEINNQYALHSLKFALKIVKRAFGWIVVEAMVVKYNTQGFMELEVCYKGCCGTLQFVAFNS
jgi:hypothetical protein